jgi:single-strand DNA-binding protein
LTKGQQVYIDGRLQSRSWNDKDGNHHTSVEVVANEMIMLGNRQSTDDQTDEVQLDEDEFPF